MLDLRSDNFFSDFFLLAERLFADPDFERVFDEPPTLDPRMFFELFVLAQLILELFGVPLPSILISDVFLCAAAIMPPRLLYGVDPSDVYFLVAGALSCPANKSALKNAVHETSTKIVIDRKVRMI